MILPGGGDQVKPSQDIDLYCKEGLVGFVDKFSPL